MYIYIFFIKNNSPLIAQTNFPNFEKFNSLKRYGLLTSLL